jgi:hypothetical protein
MKKFSLEVPYVISKFARHEEIKEKLLELIGKASAINIYDRENNVYISRTDWLLKGTARREYFEFINPMMTEHISPIMKGLDHDGFIVGSYWFQQYLKDDTHNWHQHRGASWSNVYYVELGDGAPRTTFRNPVNREEVVTPEVQEGDVLTMPGFIWHCSQPNRSEGRKTVYVFNVR